MSNPLVPYLVAGKGADSVNGLSPDFTSALAQMFAAAPPEVQRGLSIRSGYRSPEHQARLYRDAVAKYGSEGAARKWVAPPGRSRHNHGQAVDLAYASAAARQWAHANAGRFGLNFPMRHENWHIEPAGARGGGAGHGGHDHGGQTTVAVAGAPAAFAPTGASPGAPATYDPPGDPTPLVDMLGFDDPRGGGNPLAMALSGGASMDDQIMAFLAQQQAQQQTRAARPPIEEMPVVVAQGAPLSVGGTMSLADILGMV